MTDILTRLRNLEVTAEAGDGDPKIARQMRDLYRDAANEIERLYGSIKFLGHVIAAAGGEVVIPMSMVRDHPDPLVSREDRPATDDVKLKVFLG